MIYAGCESILVAESNGNQNLIHTNMEHILHAVMAIN